MAAYLYYGGRGIWFLFGLEESDKEGRDNITYQE